jgi:hypothetical protein
VTRWRPLLAAATALLAASCLRVRYAVQRIEEPVPQALLDGLRPGRDDLSSCLRAIGAPNFVWEYRGDGMALGWVFADAAGWYFAASLNVYRFASASMTLDFDNLDLPGVVLWFDENLLLLEWRRGSMRELTQGLRRPAPPDHDD